MILKKIFSLLAIIGCVASMLSCSRNDMEPEEGKTASKGPRVALYINTVGTSTRTESQEVAEKVKSLRIIMLSDGFIEYNSRIDFTNGTVSDEEGAVPNQLPYLFERATVPGTKNFYLIANEESVTHITFAGKNDNELPEGITNGITLQAFLNHYTRDKLPAEGTTGYTNSGKGVELEELLNSAFFQPELTIKDNTIYLPYTSCYKGIKATDDSDLTIEKDMYLVPGAVKFTFNFYNYWRRKVDVEKVELESLNQTNYVFANLDNSELNKTIDEKSYWWIDWMEAVAKGSHDSFTGNNKESELNKFNIAAGWILNYSMPDDSEDDISSDFIEPAPGESWRLDELTNIDTPPLLTVVKYYPESQNMGSRLVYNEEINDYEYIDAQVYQVSFWVKELRDSELVTTTYRGPYDLDTVWSLFRGTHVIVDVDMFESLVEIYCEIVDWGLTNQKPFLGYLDFDDDDD